MNDTLAPDDFAAQQATMAVQKAMAPPASDPNEIAAQTAAGALQAPKMQAQAVSVANAHSGISAATAGQSAQTARQLGVPQAAVETDPAAYATQAKANQNAALVASNPVLAKWVAANPDSARIAQDEYDKLGSIEKMWDQTQGAGYALVQQLGHSFASASLGLNRALAPIANAVGGGQWWAKNFLQTQEELEGSLRQAPDAPILQKATGTAGSLLGLLAQVTLTGGGGAAPAAAEGVAGTVANAATNAGKSMAFPSLTASANAAHDTYEQTNDAAAAARAAIGTYAFSTLQGAVPFSAPGSVAARAVSGAAAGVATSEGQRAALNLLVPSTARPFDPQEAIFQALSGAVLGGVMGPRPDVNLHEAVRQTYADAVKAGLAEKDINRVMALSKIAQESTLREHDPDAFHEFVRTVTDDSNLDAVYVDGVKLSEAFAQSEVKPTPELAQGIKEALATGGDVRIPIADYATHLAGTDLEKAILPDMKASSDGMTMKEGQDFFKKAAENMKAKAGEVAQSAQERADLDTDKQGVFQEIHSQMVAAGRDPGIASTEAQIATEFYASMAAREGMRPSEFLKANPINFAGLAPVGEGFAQSRPFEQTLTPEFKAWSNNAPLIDSTAAQTHEFTSGAKIVAEAYHGTARGDRVGTRFQAKRATSGPMAYFTSDPALASNYAKGKADTSLANEDQSYENWFKYKPKGERSPVDIVRAWYRLTPEQKNTVAERAPRVMFSDEQEADGGNKIVLGPEDHKSGTGSYDYNLAETQRGYDKRGNPLKALVEDWLNSGNLYDDEARFTQVLKLAGFPVADVNFDNPHSSEPFVYKTFVAMQKPLVTSDIPKEVTDALAEAAKRDRTRAKPGADMWDKNTRTLRDWVTALNDKDGGKYAWTSIPDKVTDVLKSLGYDGIVDWSGKGGGDIVSPVYIPFGETQVKSAIGNRGTFSSESKDILKQGERGAFDPATSTISLLKGADLSTAVHEMGHSFLDTLSHVAVGEKASESAKADFKTLLDWFGVKDEASWHAMSLDEQRPFHEQFAKSFERYMFEGKAPTQALQPIFSRVRSWMLSVYQKLSNLGAGHIDPEVRGVFDRMLASDEAIKQAEAIRSYAPLFTDAKAFGGDEARLADYLKMGQEATSAAVDSMQARSMRDMKWLSNAKNKAIKAMQREALAARKEVQAEVEHEVGERPEYAAKDYLKAHKGADKEIVAGMHGFDSAEAMQHAIDSAPNRKDVVREQTDQKMLQRHGELTDPAAVELAANEAVHNEARARFMATGLKVLTNSPLPANQIARAAKEAAEATIAGKKVGELRSDRYLAAEARANKEAIAQAAKSPEKAVDSQRAAILNNRLARAAMDAQAEVQKGLDYFKRVDKPSFAKAVGSEYMDRINELLSNYDISNRFSTGSDVAQRQQMRDWLQSEYAKTGVMPEVSDALLDFTNRKHWKELSVEEFRGLVDSIKSLEHVGRQATSVEMNGERVALDGLVTEALASTKDMPHNPPVDIQPHLEHAEGLDKVQAKYLQFKSRLRDGDASLLKVEQMFQFLEAGLRAGLGDFTFGAYSRMFTKAAKSESAERQMRADSTTAVRDIEKSIRGSKVNVNDVLDLPGLPREGRGTKWYRDELLSAVMNMGNKEGLENLVKGNGFSERALLDAAHQHLSPAEWKFIQGMLDHVNSYWAQTEALQKRLTGVAPPKVESIPIKTPDGEIPGGYFPLVRDAFADPRIDEKKTDSDALFETQFGKPTTNKGHTVARTGYIGPLHLSLQNIARHIDQVTHDLAWRETIIDMNKFLSHPDIQRDVDEVMGREYRKQFRPWLKAMANDKVFNTTGDSFWERTIRTVRTNTTIVGLGFRASTIEVHGLSALSNSFGEIGTKWMAKGAAQFAGIDRWANAKQFVYDRSPEMANRMNEWDRNVHDAIDDINQRQKAFGPVTALQKVVDGARKFAFYGVSMSDMASAMPTWHGAYLKGLAKEKDGGLNLPEDVAIEYANRAVRNAHGGGGVKDLSAVQRSKGIASLTTLFYSYWNHMYNRQRDLGKGYANLPESFRQGTGTKDFARLLARSWFYFVVPQVVHAVIKPDDSADNDGSLEHYLLHIAKEVAIGPFGGIPLVRDLVNAAVNGHDYSATPLEAAGKALVKAAQDAYKVATDEEPSKHVVANAVNVAGYTFGLPTGQATQTGKFLWDVYHGEQDPQGLREWFEGISTGKIQK